MAWGDHIFFKLEDADNRLVGELSDKQLKWIRTRLEHFNAEALEARIAKLEAANRELEMKLAGGMSGNGVVRASSAPAFELPTGREPH